MVGEKTFVNRREAGFELGKELAKKYKDENRLVLGIPRGGVEVAYEVAKVLDSELSVLVAKKLPKPGNSEVAIGAISEGGENYFTPMGNNLNESAIKETITIQDQEIQGRIRRFRRDNPLPEMENRTVILVDDGIATGATFVPAIKLCKKRKAKKVVVSAPISGFDYAPKIDSLADDVVIVDQPNEFYAVGQAYEDFHELTDMEVTDLLDEYQRTHS